MANQETQVLDSIIASRRAMLLGGGAALAALAMTSTSAKAALAPTTYTDNDILNFALNLEYLEANFYYAAAFGTTIDVPNTASVAAGGPAAGIGIGAGTATAGTKPTTGTTTAAAFTIPAVKAYAVETAIEEGKHVLFLRNALQGAAVAQPPIDVSVGSATSGFTAVANAAGITGSFNPYIAGPVLPVDVNFLAAAYIFEDVGVTAYHGAAPLIVNKTTLGYAASILAVEAYHAGLIRTSIFSADPTNTAPTGFIGNGKNGTTNGVAIVGYLSITQAISNLRASLSKTALATAPTQDDFGVYASTYPVNGATPPATTTVNLAGTTGFTAVPATNIADADASSVIAFGRNTNQVLNIVTGGGIMASGTKAAGVFFPSGLNGTFS